MKLMAMCPLAHLPKQTTHELHTLTLLVQKYRLYLKRLSGVNPGGKGKGGRMAGMDSNFAMLHAHAAMPLGVPGNYPNMPGVSAGC